jgi:hypothetical protein
MAYFVCTRPWLRRLDRRRPAADERFAANGAIDPSDRAVESDGGAVLARREPGTSGLDRRARHAAQAFMRVVDAGEHGAGAGLEVRGQRAQILGDRHGALGRVVRERREPAHGIAGAAFDRVEHLLPARRHGTTDQPAARVAPTAASVHAARSGSTT